MTMRTSAIALTILLLTAATVSASTINGTTLSGKKLTITGTGFSGTPLTVTFNGKEIPVVSNTATQIVATLKSIPVPGSYRLVVMSGTASTFSYLAISASPNIVAQVALKKQTANIPLTTLLTPQATGLYRVSGYMDCSGDTLNVAEFKLSWTDPTGNANLGTLGAVSNCTSNSPTTWSYTVLDTKGSPLSYEVAGAISFPPFSYDIFFTVEQLQ
ncbi:MAG: IPT/TIG domain-containing protein [Terriglobales bacterium]